MSDSEPIRDCTSQAGKPEGAAPTACLEVPNATPFARAESTSQRELSILGPHNKSSRFCQLLPETKTEYFRSLVVRPDILYELMVV